MVRTEHLHDFHYDWATEPIAALRASFEGHDEHVVLLQRLSEGRRV